MQDNVADLLKWFSLVELGKHIHSTAERRPRAERRVLQIIKLISSAQL
jgi:hypothetical protein